MSIPVIVNGAFGKMGTLACEAINNHPEFTLVAALGSKDNLEQAIKEYQAKIVIELTSANCVYKNSLTIIEENAHPVIGASGLTEKEIEHLTNISNEKMLGGIIVPNFSIGAILMMQCAKLVSKYLNDVEIIEAHHPQKIDSPSATAIKTAKIIAEQKIRQNSNAINDPARGEMYYNIPIHSVRLPGLIARQDVIFGSTGETLSIIHNTLDRQSFMPGLLMACNYVNKIKTLQYGLENVLL